MDGCGGAGGRGGRLAQPLEDVDLAEGTRVEVRVPGNGRGGRTRSANSRWTSLAEMAKPQTTSTARAMRALSAATAPAPGRPARPGQHAPPEKGMLFFKPACHVSVSSVARTEAEASRAHWN